MDPTGGMRLAPEAPHGHQRESNNSAKATASPGRAEEAQSAWTDRDHIVTKAFHSGRSDQDSPPVLPEVPAATSESRYLAAASAAAPVRYS